MVDDVKDILETAENKGSADACERARIARERRESEQRRRLEELRAHAAAAQAQRERRDEDRRRRQDEQRHRDTDRRHQVEERKRAIWEASISRREALLQRERDREERLERARATRSSPRSAFAFGSSTPRLLEPADTSGFFWAARRASSTSNVMFASAPLTRRASALQLDMCDSDNKDEADRQPMPMATWNSVARRRTDLVPTMPAPRVEGGRSGETTPGSRPASAMSAAPAPAPAPAAPRRPHTARRPRPASIAGTGVNTPRGPGAESGVSAATTPSVSRDATATNMAARRASPAPPARRPRPVSMHLASTHTPLKPALTPGEGKPPLHRKPKLSKDQDKSPRGSKARSVSPSPAPSKESSVDKDTPHKKPSTVKDNSQVNPTEVTQKLEALQVQNGEGEVTRDMVNETANIAATVKREEPEEKKLLEENKKTEEEKTVEITNSVDDLLLIDVPKMEEPMRPVEVQKKEEKKEHKIEKREEKKEVKMEEKREEKRETLDKPEESEMTASMTARRITTEEQAKAALAERRRKAREELERQAELERQRLEREAEEETERQRLEEERQRREEEEARELAALQRSMEEEKLRKAIEAQQQLERDEAERKAREEVERQARAREEEGKRKASEEAERVRREEAEREERERVARKQRVEAIMARTRLRKAEEDKKQEGKDQNGGAPAMPEVPAATDAGDDNRPREAADNGNGDTHHMLGLNDPLQEGLQGLNKAEATSNGNVAAAFLHAEREAEAKTSGPDFVSHNGHTHPLTLQNAI